MYNLPVKCAAWRTLCQPDAHASWDQGQHVKVMCKPCCQFGHLNPVTGLPDSANAVTNQRGPSRTVGRAMTCAAEPMPVQNPQKTPADPHLRHVTFSEACMCCQRLSNTNVLQAAAELRCSAILNSQDLIDDVICKAWATFSSCRTQIWFMQIKPEWLKACCSMRMECFLECRSHCAYKWHNKTANGISWAEFKINLQVADMLQQKGVLLDWQLSTQWHKSCLGGFSNWMPWQFSTKVAVLV